MKVHYAKNKGSKNIICSGKPGKAATVTHIKRDVTCKVCKVMLAHERMLLKEISRLKREIKALQKVKQLVNRA